MRALVAGVVGVLILIAFAWSVASKERVLREGTTVLVLVYQGGRVAGARTTAGDILARQTVLAAGAWSGALLGDGAPRAAVTCPARGQILLLLIGVIVLA